MAAIALGKQIGELALQWQKISREDEAMTNTACLTTLLNLIERNCLNEAGIAEAKRIFAVSKALFKDNH